MMQIYGHHMVIGIFTLTCAVLLDTSGCETPSASLPSQHTPGAIDASSAYVVLPNEQSRDRQTGRSQSAPVGVLFTHSVKIRVESEPSGSEVFGVRIIDDEKGWEVGESLGTTPLDIPIGIAIQNGEAWFKDPNVLGGKIWQMQKRLHRHDLNFFVSKREYYGVFVHMKVEFEIRPNGDLMVQECETDSYSHPVHVGQKETIKAAPRPIGLLEHASKAAPQLARLIEDGAYYDAEELRLKRTQSLREQLDRNEVFWVHYADDLKRMPTTMTTRVQEQLIKSELQQLNHLVGLLDPQLMGLRKQLLAKLHEGDVDSALVLANAVETMEKRYYPPESKTVYTEIRTPSSPQPTQVGQADGKQEILIQQKPYYGAANIVEALGAMRGTKLDPAAYQKALGGAQLLDIMGFGSMINK